MQRYDDSDEIADEARRVSRVFANCRYGAGHRVLRDAVRAAGRMDAGGLVHLIAGLEEPDAGEIWIAGECVAANRRTLGPPYARGVGFVFQDLALWPHLTVAGNLDFVLSSAGVPKRERIDRINETLRLVRIDRFARNHPNQLSGGEQQRVAIARAIVAHPRLLLLD